MRVRASTTKRVRFSVLRSHSKIGAMYASGQLK
jgi:hypothetical protein